MAEIRPEIWVDDPGQTIQYYEQVLEFKRRFANEREGRVVFGEVEFNGSNPIMVAQAHEGPGAVAAV
ncbi:MAG TPA: VOC family protein, partial [Dehalococcoidia bacterium]|nr:VOC family protein [Dehalococcoidia bacterium]